MPKFGRAQRPRMAEEIEAVVGHFLLQRPVGIAAPFGQQLVEADRIDDRA
jgi:hypothetical protein